MASMVAPDLAPGTATMSVPASSISQSPMPPRAALDRLLRLLACACGCGVKFTETDLLSADCSVLFPATRSRTGILRGATVFYGGLNESRRDRTGDNRCLDGAGLFPGKGKGWRSACRVRAADRRAEEKGGGGREGVPVRAR